MPDTLRRIEVKTTISGRRTRQEWIFRTLCDGLVRLAGLATVTEFYAQLFDSSRVLAKANPSSASRKVVGSAEIPVGGRARRRCLSFRDLRGHPPRVQANLRTRSSQRVRKTPLLLLAMERKTFDRELRRFLVRHAKRGGLLRRLTRGWALAVMSDDGEPPDLRAENARLVALLESHGIEWRKSSTVDVQPTPSGLNADQKVALFRRLFRGRTDVYPVRWESKAGKTGYAPACANEWRAGICEKPRIKCSDCGHRSLIALTDRTIYDHLAGRHTTGVYPLLTDDTCNFLAVDFDDADWCEDAKGFAKSCRETGRARRVGSVTLGRGCACLDLLFDERSCTRCKALGHRVDQFHVCSDPTTKLTSYDRLFPSQDTLPRGGFGNLIALPLQKLRGSKGAVCSSTMRCRRFQINGRI